MNLFRGLLNLIGMIRPGGGEKADHDGDSLAGVESTLRDILEAIRSIRISPPIEPRKETPSIGRSSMPSLGPAPTGPESSSPGDLDALNAESRRAASLLSALSDTVSKLRDGILSVIGSIAGIPEIPKPGDSPSLTGDKPPIPKPGGDGGDSPPLTGDKPPIADRDSGGDTTPPAPIKFNLPTAKPVMPNIRGKSFEEIAGKKDRPELPKRPETPTFNKPAPEEKSSGVLGKMAGALKLVGVFTAIAGAGVYLGKKLFSFAENVNKSNEALSQYSAQLALSFADLKISDFRRDIALAQATEGTGSTLAEEFNGLRDDFQPIKETLTSFKNTVGVEIVRITRTLVQIAAWGSEILGLKGIAEDIENNTKPDRDLRTAGVRAAMDIASGGWRTPSGEALHSLDERDEPLPPTL